MKKILFSVFLFMCISGHTQHLILDEQSTKYATLLIEITDTVETAYHTYYGANWVQKGFYTHRETISDSIGVDSVRITRLFYLKRYDPYPELRESSDTILPYDYRQIYLDYSEKKYLNGCSSRDSRFDNY